MTGRHEASFGIGIVVMIVTSLLLPGLFMLQPDKAAVLTLFGASRGTARDDGILRVDPLLHKQEISPRVRNFGTTPWQANDANGNPLHVGAARAGQRRK